MKKYLMSLKNIIKMVKYWSLSIWYKVVGLTIWEFNMKTIMIKMEMAALALLILTKNNIFTLNSNLTLPTEFFHFLTSLTSKPHSNSLLLVPRIGKRCFRINLKVKLSRERFRLLKSLKMSYPLIEIPTINLYQSLNP
jgi:hypothetical protein